MNQLLSFLRKHHLDKIAKISEELITSAHFQRLQDISYLSTFHLVFQRPIHFTRFEHCLHTALLLAKLLVRNKLTGEKDMQIVIFGLLHDIGHIFFSHLGERSLNEQEQFNHEDYGRFIIQNHLKAIFRRYNMQLPLLENIALHHRILVHSHCDLDTIQGILETARIFHYNYFDEMLLVNEISFRKETHTWQITEKGAKLLLQFWKLKDTIYHELVYSLQNQYIEMLILKYLPKIPDISKDAKESEILLKIFMLSNFKKEMNKVTLISMLNSFYCDITKEELIFEAKNLLSEIIAKDSNANYAITKVKHFRVNSLLHLRPRTLEDCENHMKVNYRSLYRIYAFNVKKDDKLLFLQKIENFEKY